MSNKFWSPMILSAKVGPLTNIGDDLSIDPLQLLNPNRGSMLIDQFRFTFDYIPAAPSPMGAFTEAQNMIAAEIRVGSIPLMPKPVTVAVLAPPYVGALTPSVVNFQANPFGGNYDWHDTVLVWHLHKPLYVPRDVSLSARFVLQRLFSQGSPFTEPSASIQVRFTVAGRSLSEDDQVPTEIIMPWVTETRARVSSPTFVSGDSDLINSHDVPLNVKQFVGSNYIRPVTGVWSGTETTTYDIYVQMTGSNGTAIVREPTPFYLLFPGSRNTLNVDAVLQPGQFVRTALNAPTVPGAPGAPSTLLETVESTAIGMHGYRKVPMPRLNR